MGWTTILHHENRVNMKITDKEYAIYDFIYKNKDGLSVRKIRDVLGYQLGSISRAINKGKKLKYLTTPFGTTTTFATGKWVSNAYPKGKKTIETDVTNMCSKMEQEGIEVFQNGTKVFQNGTILFQNGTGHYIHSNKLLIELLNKLNLNFKKIDFLKSGTQKPVTQKGLDVRVAWVNNVQEDETYISSCVEELYALGDLKTPGDIIKLVQEFFNKSKIDKADDWLKESDFRRHFRNSLKYKIKNRKVPAAAGSGKIDEWRKSGSYE